MPAPKCSVCSSPKRKAIDAAIAAGRERLTIAGEYEVTLRQLAKHEAEPAVAVEEKKPSRRRRVAGRGGAVSATVPPLAAAEAVPLRPAACRICEHAKRPEIEAAIARGDAAVAVGRTFFLSADEVKAHAAEQRSEPPAPAAPLELAWDEEEEELGANATAVSGARASVMRWRRRRVALVRAKAHASEIEAADKAEHAALRLLSQCEAAADVSEAQIMKSTAWRHVEAAMLRALEEYPEAAKRVTAALRELAGYTEAAA